MKGFALLWLVRLYYASHWADATGFGGCEPYREAQGSAGAGVFTAPLGEPRGVRAKIEMEKSRLEFLQEALNNNPDDAFVRYALAMELTKSAPEEAWPHFDYLLTRHPEYSATYYQAGIFLWKQGRREEAQKVLAQGIAVTRRQGNQHAQSELQAALDELTSES